MNELTSGLQYYHREFQLQDGNSTTNQGSARVDRSPETLQETKTLQKT